MLWAIPITSEAIKATGKPQLPWIDVQIDITPKESTEIMHTPIIRIKLFIEDRYRKFRIRTGMFRATSIKVKRGIRSCWPN
jgi:hypothetical protein